MRIDAGRDAWEQILDEDLQTAMVYAFVCLGVVSSLLSLKMLLIF